MTTLTDYTSYAAVRAVLGVATKEITDTVLGLPQYLLQFEMDADSVDVGNGGVLAMWVTVSAIPSNSRTPNQVRFLDLVGMFANFSVARALLASVEMFAPQQITDGKAKQVRKDPYETLRNGVQGGFARIRGYLADLLLVLAPSASVPSAPTLPTFITSTGIATDPVTNA